MTSTSPRAAHLGCHRKPNRTTQNPATGVTATRTHGVNHIWSRDRDLRRFDAISVTDPFDDRFADHFPRR